MSDLISRSAVLNFIKEEVKQDRPDDFKIRNIQRFIGDMPTAYNIDKIVAELEESGQKMSEAKGNPWDSSDHKYYKAISVKKAISIVKAGGVE